MTATSAPGSGATAAVQSCIEVLAEQRRLLEGRLARLDAQVATDRRLREELGERLIEGETSRHVVLGNPRRFGAPVLSEIATAHFETRSDIAAADERIGNAADHVSLLGTQRESLDRLGSQIQRLAESPPPPADPAAARFHVATRRVYRLADEQRGAGLRDSGGDPVRALSDLLQAAEVAERRAAGVRDPVALRDEIAALAGRATDALEALRRLAFQLHPPALATGGLVSALRQLIDVQTSQSPIQIRLDVVGAPRRLQPDIELTLYRVAEEALRNVRLHAHSPAAQVILVFHQARIGIVVRDEGDGFDVHATMARLAVTQHLGVVSMRERVELVGGRFELRSQVGAGTEVRATVDT